MRGRGTLRGTKGGLGMDLITQNRNPEGRMVGWAVGGKGGKKKMTPRSFRPWQRTRKQKSHNEKKPLTRITEIQTKTLLNAGARGSTAGRNGLGAR